MSREKERKEGRCEVMERKGRKDGYYTCRKEEKIWKIEEKGEMRKKGKKQIKNKKGGKKERKNGMRKDESGKE